MDERLRVTEIFQSLQGESTWAGVRCVFVRMAGCDLRCVWCDTQYAYEGGEELSVDEIVRRVAAFACPLVELTGGEPLLHGATPALARALLAAGCTVLVETNGAQPVELLPEGAIRIMDLKCPDSGMCARNRLENVEKLGPRDEVKFVLASRQDYEWARDKIVSLKLAQKVHAVLLSVAAGRLDGASVARWMIEDKLPARFQLQLHKLIWAPEAHGV